MVGLGWGGKMRSDYVVVKLEAYSRASNKIQQKHINKFKGVGSRKRQ
jgi:hypothetical protein